MKKINVKLTYILMFVFMFSMGGIISNNTVVYASEESLSSKNFVTWNQGGIKGYDVEIDLNGTTFNDTSSVIIKLYSGDTLLQTNTAIISKLSGSSLLTPFDVFGIFDYAKDGYFTNTKESEYGKKLAANKVIAIVTLKNGNTLTVTNTNLIGDASKMMASEGSVLGASKYNFTKLLKIKSKGTEVVELQKALNERGYNCGKADGGFGPKTKEAVAKFQIANNQKGDGIVGPATRAILNK